jgi:hypothetical protein
MLDRLMQHHHRITLTGDSLRSKKATQAVHGSEGTAVMAVNAMTRAEG